MTTPVTPRIHRIATKQWLPLLITVITLYVILPQLKLFRTALQATHHADASILGLAGLAVVVTFFCGAGAYKALAFKKLPYAPTLLAQLAANFFNRVLPAGVGGIGANYRYLRHQKHTTVQASTVVAANNSLGFIGHMLLLSSLVLCFHRQLTLFHVARTPALIALFVLLVCVGTALFTPRLRRHMYGVLQAFVTQLLQYRTYPSQLGLALALQICLTLANVTAFWLCALALHLNVTFVAALLIFSFGFGIGTAVPTPGGLGGVEAGLATGLVAYHHSVTTALAVVLIYRLLSYWLPLLLSAPICIYATRRHYFA